MPEIKKNWNTFFVLFVAFLMYKVVDNHSFFLGKLGYLLRLLSPFIGAFFIAYLLNPLMVKLEKNVKKMRRLFSVAIIYLCFIGIITLLVTVITPVIVKNIMDIIDILPKYIGKAETFITNNMQNLSILDEIGATDYLNQNLEQIFNKALTFLNLTLSGVLYSIIGITSGVAKAFLAIIISAYLLLDKEKFIRGIKRNVQAFFGEDKAEKIFLFGQEANGVFANFLIGKLIDSLIIGIICYIGLYFMKVDFAALISIIVGITNMIPYFGPFIGAVPAILITLFISPIQALWVALFILALQQFDGLILGPKILGDKVGISPFYIMLAIVIGGGFFGPVGMLLGVPVFKTLLLLWDRFISYRLEQKVRQSEENAQ